MPPNFRRRPVGSRRLFPLFKIAALAEVDAVVDGALSTDLKARRHVYLRLKAISDCLDHSERRPFAGAQPVSYKRQSEIACNCEASMGLSAGNRPSRADVPTVNPAAPL